MNAGINLLPFDIVHSVAALLDVRAYLHLSWTSKGFYKLLQDEGTARKCIQHNFHHYREIGTASAYLSKPRQAISYVYDRRESLRAARPYSASVLAYGTTFTFCHGTLCYLSGTNIRILDVHNHSRLEKVISSRVFSGKLGSASTGSGHANDYQPILTLLSCKDGVLVLLVERNDLPGHWLFALDIRDCITSNVVRPQQRGRLLLKRRLTSVTKLFVRNNAKHLYVGTHSALADHGHHEWLLQGFSLDTGQPIPSEPIQLVNFVGSEIGTTAAFTIQDDHFYAVTNQSSFETEEVDWTSDYKYIKFSTDAIEPAVELESIWRRQHIEGPINDAWADLQLQVDEETNQLKIIECRKEWLGGRSVCTRTYYQESFTAKMKNDDDSKLRHSTFLPLDDPLVSTLDKDSKPNYSEGGIRSQRNYHREDDGSGTPALHDYIRAKTKYHSYSCEAHSFLDLVSDSVKIPGLSRTRERLRLRVASRLPQSPLLADGSTLKLRPREFDSQGTPIADSEEAFYPTQIQPLWPPEHAPQELHDILCPGGRAGIVHAVSDNHAMIYTAGSPDPQYNKERAIIMLSFDPCWGRTDLNRMQLDANVDTSRMEQTSLQLEKSNNRAAEDGLKRKAMLGLPESQSAETEVWRTLVKKRKHNSNDESLHGVGDATQSVSGHEAEKPRLLWKEKARHLSIGRGFYFPKSQLRRPDE